MDYKSVWPEVWPTFHGLAIWPFILKSIWCINIILIMLCLYDPKFDLKINVGHSDLYFMVWWPIDTDHYYQRSQSRALTIPATCALCGETQTRLHTACTVFSTLDNNHNLHTLGKSQPDCTQPVQSARHSWQYLGNICRIKLRTTFIIYELILWRFSFISLIMQPAILEFAQKNNK